MRNLIEIVPDDSHHFSVLYNGEEFNVIIAYDIRVYLWKQANICLENDVVQVGDKYSDFEYGEFLWCLTWENHRNDGLLGTIYYYYLIEILRHIISCKKVDDIRVHKAVPISLYHKISSLQGDFNIVQNGHLSKTYFLNRVKTFLAPFRFSVSFFLKAIFKKTISPINNAGKMVWVQMKDDFRKSRYGASLESVEKDNIFVFNKFILTEPKVHPFGDRVICFYNFLSLYSLYEGLLVVKKIKKEIFQNSKNCSLYSNLFYNLVKEQNFWHFFQIVMKSLLFDRALDFYKPSALFLVTSLADPISRLPATIAFRHGIPTHIVACRSMLSIMRAEDRCSRNDLSRSNKTSMGDNFIVRDEYSRKTLVKQGIEDKNIYYNFAKEIEQNRKDVYEIYNGIVLLLTQAINNQKLIEIVTSCNFDGFKCIYLRSHPNRWKKNEVTDEQMKLLKNLGLDIIDITDISMQSIHCTDTIAITTNSTSGVEMASTGAGIVWMPFITEHSLQFADVMENLGLACYDKAEFDRFVYSIRHEDKLRKFIAKTEKEFTDNFRPRQNFNNEINLSDFLTSNTN